MAVLPIITGQGSPILRKKTMTVPKVTKDVLVLIRNMNDTTQAADGLGLAAPQVGVGQRICLARLHGRLTPLINPVITWKSATLETGEEGCLSLPGIYVPVTRSRSIVVRYLDGKGKEQERKLEGMDARVVQHEVDHLDGILIVDYVTSASTNAMLL